MNKIKITRVCHCCCCCCSVAHSCLTLCDPMDCSKPGFPVPHYLPEFAQVHVHCIGDAVQPFYPLSALLLLPSIFPSKLCIPYDKCLYGNITYYWCRKPKRQQFYKEYQKELHRGIIWDIV